MPAMIVFSHLRWDLLFRRPRHLLSRQARHYRVLFIEEPISGAREEHWKVSSPLPDLFVCQPHITMRSPNSYDHLPPLRTLLQQLAPDHEDHIVWFCTPMALPSLQDLRPRTVVYDCMEQFSASTNASPQLLQREGALLTLADLVFCSGPSLGRAKREQRPDVHCFPNGVEAEHFTLALDRSNSHPAHKEIPGPRLGFFGAIDERIDVALIAQLADARPSWHIVLVGPVSAIDSASLPQRANIHYLGPQPYQLLPQFMAGWEVCLLPFVLNDSTRFPNPAMALEYMAAELPIVSTAVPDVAGRYGEVIYIAQGAPEFVAACESAMLESTEQRADKVRKMRATVSAASWDASAAAMHRLIDAELAAHRVHEPFAMPASSTCDARCGEAAMDRAAHTGMLSASSSAPD